MYACLITLVLCSTNNISKDIVSFFRSNFFHSFKYGGKSIPFRLYWSIKALIFGILWVLFAMLWQFHAQLKHIENNYHHYFADLLLFFYFSTIQENLYMIRSVSNLLFEGGNTINQYYQEQTRFLSLILLNLFDNFIKEIQKVLP